MKLFKSFKYRKRKFYIGNEENYNEENIKTGNHKTAIWSYVKI